MTAFNGRQSGSFGWFCLRDLPWYPLALAAYVVLALYAQNVQVVSPWLVMRPLVLIVFGTSALYLLVFLVLRDWHRAGLVVAALLLATFSWGHFVRFVVPPNLIFYKTRFFVGYASVVSAFLFYVWRRKRPFQRWTYPLNVSCTALLVWSIGLVATSPTCRSSFAMHFLQPAEAKTPSPASVRDGHSGYPDIYLIVLDSYPRDDVLWQHFGFRNDNFIRWLQSNGFYVVKSSRSNYNKSLWSLASCFNMDYLHVLLPACSPSDRNIADLLSLFRHNRLFSLLRSHGYRILAFRTGFDYLDLDREADIYLSPAEPIANTFEMMLLELTPIPRILARIGGSESMFAHHRRRILFTFNQLSDLSQYCETGPLFVYAHVICPHEPIVFDEDGQAVRLQDFFMLGAARPSWVPFSDYAAAYIAQLKFVNRMTIRVVKSLSTNDVVAIVSDHGLLNPEKGDRSTTLKNFMAVRIPADKSSPESLNNLRSLVNLFPVVIRAAFGVIVPFQADESYFVEWDHPYRYQRCAPNLLE